MLVAVYVYLFTDPVQRAYWLWILCQVALLMQLTFRPFHSTVDNALETASLFVLTYVAGTQVAYGYTANSITEIMHIVVLIGLGCIVLAFLREFAANHKYRVGSWKMVDTVSWWWATHTPQFRRHHRPDSDGEQLHAIPELSETSIRGLTLRE